MDALLDEYAKLVPKVRFFVPHSLYADLEPGAMAT